MHTRDLRISYNPVIPANEKKDPCEMQGPGEVILLVVGLYFLCLFCPAEAGNYVNHITHGCPEY